MCLYPRLMFNPKYKANKKNGGVIPHCSDNRVKYVPIGCGKCIECKKQKSRQWQCRLQEDIKKYRNGKFITLTFSTESLKEIEEKDNTTDAKLRNKKTYIPIKELKGYEKDNAIAIYAVRHFLERWRKKYKVSLRHWLITELGHGNTEHLHLHGIVWTDDLEEVKRIWKYGYVWTGKESIVTGKKENYVNAKTVNYITKYITKMDEKHYNYEPIVLTSSGIGANYMEGNAYTNKYKQHGTTSETYRTETGHKISLPIYWRNKIYTDAEREKLWIQKLDKDERWVCGERVSRASTEQGEKAYESLLQYHRARTEELGYRSPKWIWEKEEYERARRRMIHEERIQGASGRALRSNLSQQP